MKILITGAAGFIGDRLARELLQRGQLDTHKIERLLLADLHPPAVDLQLDPRVDTFVGDLLQMTEALSRHALDGVFHLASAVSAECERDFDLGLAANLDSTRALLDALRRAGRRPRLVFSSSVAVFGADPALPLPAVIDDRTLPAPQTSYGAQKFICEQLVADYSRKGYIDGRSARLMTVAVRPGRPNGAASGFLSAIIREPLAGQPAVCPVPPDTQVALASPANTIAGLIAAFEASHADFGGRTALNLPALSLRVGELLNALEQEAGAATRQLVRFEPDAAIQAIVSGWPARVDDARAARLGLRPDPDAQALIRQYRQHTSR
ncbi:NAD-dependent epimerase [Chromobacterium sp. LK1]|uniref:D-erythronate dehydrogenase n=1 Tax=Chromobacterium sp. LK1 TaxID=1628193 RepID=UPI0006546979|nr:D-erythronate dehydrogenase [Chromobacterium sp. LK1]KMN37794.1 NAD-dependent epimerase [Chromobacterium sp. LK1]